MIKNILYIILGMLIMFVILKLLSSKTLTGTGDTTKALKELAFTGEAYNLIMSNEFRELVKTPEFKKFTKTLAAEQLNILSKTLAG